MRVTPRDQGLRLSSENVAACHCKNFEHLFQYKTGLSCADAEEVKKTKHKKKEIKQKTNKITTVK
jgi:hypothetical protein